MKFCPKCHNMLYPLEESREKKLYYICKRCHYKILSISNEEERCVFQSRITNSIDDPYFDRSEINTDVVDDPTLQRTDDVKCAKCKMSRSVFFNGHSSNPDDSLSLIFVCCNKRCLHAWRVPKQN